MAQIHIERIEALRGLMSQYGWDAVVVCGSDPHSSEYPAPRWKQVEWLTGFTGEAGDVVITMDHAGLWTDSRYFIQALSQLQGTGVELHKTRVPDAVSIAQWLGPRVKIVAVDGLCQSRNAIADIRKSLEAACQDGINDWAIVDAPDMFDSLWIDRPSVPQTPVTTLDVECFGGISRLDKISWLRKWMLLHSVDKVLLSSLDEIAWLLNVRGSDIDYNPLVISYLIVTQDYVKWFVRKPLEGDPDLDTVDSFDELVADDVDIEDYDALFTSLAELDSEEPVRIFIDPSTVNYHIYSRIQEIYEEESIVCGVSPVIAEKAVKTNSEIEHLRQAYIEDGVAVTLFLHWLDEQTKECEVTEWEASEKLTSFRAAIPGYRGNSFENISAYGPNAALPHYSTPSEGSAIIRREGLYLVDSGGQYLTGTTDITRTVPMGECTDLEREDYTLVLKGMIALSMAKFPKGTAGCQLDVLARQALWHSKRNFGHGTGHGIGYYLCVHEGPQSIRQDLNPQALLPGMVTSNEPGIYREGLFGIRHENIILCKESGANDFGQWMEFETLTCCHIDTSAVVADLLTVDERNWLNQYNEYVFSTLSPLLPHETAEWLRSKTMPL